MVIHDFVYINFHIVGDVLLDTTLNNINAQLHVSTFHHTNCAFVMRSLVIEDAIPRSENL